VFEGIKNTNAWWEPQSIGIQDVDGKKANIPDGKLCSAGVMGFDKLDTTPANIFNATTLEPDAASGGKEFTMNYWYTVKHMTRFHRVYMTKPSWDYQTATNLSWADLEDKPFCEWNDMTQNTNISPDSWKCAFPDRPKGSRVMFLGFWQRSDSLEAFMSCSDVVIGGSEQKPPQAAVPSPSA
jgi:chitin-binding protein